MQKQKNWVTLRPGKGWAAKAWVEFGVVGEEGHKKVGLLKG